MHSLPYCGLSSPPSKHPFQVNKTSANVPRTLLASPDHHMVHTIRTRDFDPLQDPATVPGHIPIESTLGVTTGQLVVERDNSHSNRLRICYQAFGDAVASRVFNVYDFPSCGDREKFLAIVNHMAVVPASMPRHLATTPLPTIPVMQPVDSALALWGQDWPTLDVTLCICAYERVCVCVCVGGGV